jgi:hypothetical protein
MRLLSDTAFALFLWVASLPVVVFVFGLLVKVVEGPTPKNLLEASFATSVAAGCLAWLLLFAMTIAWLARRRLHRLIPAVGHILGVIGITPFVLSSYGLALFWVLPGILLVIVVTGFHSSVVSPSSS